MNSTRGEPMRCRFSETRPPQDDYAPGYYFDGGFHHCHCGAIVEWTSRPEEGGVVGEHQDVFLGLAVTRLRSMPRDEVEALLGPAPSSGEENTHG